MRVSGSRSYARWAARGWKKYLVAVMTASWCAMVAYRGVASVCTWISFLTLPSSSLGRAAQRSRSGTSPGAVNGNCAKYCCAVALCSTNLCAMRCDVAVARQTHQSK